MAGDTLHRKLIRDNVKDLLEGYSIGETVTTNNAQAWFENELPAVDFSTPEDIPNKPEDFPTYYLRKIRGIITIWVEKTASTVAEDEADEIAGLIEDILLPNRELRNPPPGDLQGVAYLSRVTPGVKITDNIVLGPVSTVKTEDGKTDVVGLQCEYIFDFDYSVKTGNVDTFVTGGVHWNIAGEQAEADQAQDLLKPDQP